ncbi:MAG: hypothetical protein M0022_00675 [Desulfobacteraceae bacterium]|nr:hypothetical protein [Desulfobacteraceae bacterium]
MRISCMVCEAEFSEGKRKFKDVKECAFISISSVKGIPNGYTCSEHLNPFVINIPLPTKILTSFLEQA